MEDNTIRLFMWGYQRFLQSTLNTEAEMLFKSMDANLAPNIFFLGVLTDEQKDKYNICLEPEENSFNPSIFKNIKSIAKNFEELDEESNIFHSHPIAQKNNKERIHHKSYVTAIKKILNKETFYDDIDFFIARPILIEDYLVFCILSLNKSALNQHYSLRKNIRDKRFRISRSFIESSIYIFLEECRETLKDYDTPSLIMKTHSREIFRKAGEDLMYTISSSGNNFEGLHGLYRACNEIASMKYEGNVGVGRMIIAPQNHSYIKLTLELKKPININDYRKIRKFLEISDNKTSIISDSAYIYGLGEIKNGYNSKDEDIFSIDFTNHFKWILSHDANPLMSVEYRQPSLPKEKIDKQKFYNSFERIFDCIKKNQVDTLWEIVNEGIKQKHGTLLVVSDDAENESERLKQQSFQLEPLILNKEIVQKITSIDGAVLLDRNSKCYGIGVILDGLASDKGDSSRGARYNSAIKYYESFKDKTSIILIVISEDGMINLIPNLKPQIKHSEIIHRIESLNKILNSDSFQRKKFASNMNFFNDNRFYITKEEAEKINSLRVKIEEKFENELSKNLRIIYSDLVPNPEMNSSYYLDE